MANFLGGIISISIGVIFLTGVFIATVKNTNTTTWTSAEVAIFGTLTIVGIAGLLFGVASVFGVV